MGRDGSEEAGSKPEGDVFLVVDTSLSTAAVALGTPDGGLLAEATWQAGYRHGEELLGRLDALLRDHGVRLADIAAIVAGTGPGAFTGMRVGLATAKALARGLEIPIVGVPSSAALLAAAADALVTAGEDRGAGSDRASTPSSGSPSLVLALPAGPSDRIVVVGGVPRLVRGGDDPGLPAEARLVAVDLDGRAPEDALELGRHAVPRFAATLLRLGAARLAAGERDDVARLVPEYVTLPRGVPAMTGEVRWSRERT